jgi:hypothetical protein
MDVATTRGMTRDPLIQSAPGTDLPGDHCRIVELGRLDGYQNDSMGSVDVLTA